MQTNRQNKTLGYYIWSSINFIFILIAIIIFDLFCKKMGLNKKDESLLLLWIMEAGLIVYSILIYHRRLTSFIKLELSLNGIVISTFYVVLLLFLEHLGYNIIPVIGISIFGHFLGIAFIITIINETILLPYLLKKHERKKV